MSDDRGPAVLAVTAAMIAIATFFVALRFVSRIFIIHKVKLDDWFILAAWFFAFGLSFSICYGVKYGLGRHMVTISAHDQDRLLRLEYAFSVLYNPALMATKTSIGIFYSTLSGSQSVFKWGNIGTMVIVNVAGLALSLLNIFQCRPLTAIFAVPRPESAHCTDIITLYLSSAPVNILTDLLLLLLPLPLLKGMRLPKKQKIILYITFGFGVFVTAVDIVRISYLQEATTNRLESAISNHKDGSTGDPRDNTDFSWYASLSFMWTAIEVNVGIMCASVPHLKPLVARFLPKMLKDSGGTKVAPARQRSVATVNSSEMRMAHRVPSAADQLPRAALEPQHNRIGSSDESNGNESEGEMGFMDFLNVTSDRPASRVPLTRANVEDGRVGSSDERSGNESHEEMGFTDFLNDTRATSPEGEIPFVDFITTPGADEMPKIERSQTAMTTATHHSPEGTSFLDFMDMTELKSIVYMTNRESIKPIAHVTFLFFLWGFAYGLLNTLNSRFQLIAQMTPRETIAQHSMYYAGYFVGPLTIGRLILKNWGFKACYIIGLMIYGTGALVFWPAAVLTSFAAFLISNFIVGVGLSTLEIAANPFMALCGPPRYAEVRLNISQGFQAIGSVVSPLLAQKALFNNVLDAPSLVDVQWTYLAICLFTYILAYIYYAIDLPEVSDAELEAASRSVLKNGKLDELRHNWTITITLIFAVLSLFLYVGAQEAVGTSIDGYLTNVVAKADTSSYTAVGHSLFAIARFIAAFAGLWIKPRYLLMFFFTGAMVFSGLAMHFEGTTSGVMVLMVYFFEGPLFSLVYAIPLRGLGRYTKDGAALITSAISGGAILNPVQYAVAEGHGYKYSYCVVVAGFAGASLFAVYLLAYPPAWEQTNPPKENTFMLPASVARGGGGRGDTLASSASPLPLPLPPKEGELQDVGGLSDEKMTNEGYMTQ